MYYYVCGLLVLANLLGCHSVLAKQSTDNRKPNFVFILADDLGWRDVGYNGSTFYETPNIDRLAQQSMVFTNGYAAAPLCSATRAAILTGKYPGRLHLTAALTRADYGNKPGPKRAGARDQKLTPPQQIDHLPPEEITFAEILNQAGYVTAFMGKWHLGLEPSLPTNQGFDLNVAGGRYPGPPSYFSPYKNKYITDGPPGEYLTDRLTDEAVKFLQHNKNKPFFLYLPHYAIHSPWQAKENLIQHYQAKVKSDNQQNNPTVAGMIHSLDQSVGRIVKKLDELDLAKNTVVIFTSDNGGLTRIPGVKSTRPQAGKRITSNAPLRGGKAMIWEGGIRVPTMVRWPGLTKPASKCHTPICSVDYFPTIMEIASLKTKPQQIVDGESIVPLLKQSSPLKRKAIYFHFPHYIAGYRPDPKVRTYWTRPCSAIRQGDYKLIYFDQDHRVELYNLRNDIGEKNNLADKAPARAKKMRQKLLVWRKSANVQLPTPNPVYNPSYIHKQVPQPKKKRGKKK
jgi:arylsulfatase A-like enzyme